MKLCLVNHTFRYELEKLIRIFLPFEKIEFSETEEITDSCAVTKIINNKTALAELYYGGKVYNKDFLLDENTADYEKECELRAILHSGEYLRV